MGGGAPRERGRPARMHSRSVPLSFPAMGYPATLPSRTAWASPHFSPGGMIMAQDFSLQRVLATEERSGHYGRGSMCALKGKRPARACPAPSVIRKPFTLEPIKVLKDKLPFVMPPAAW